MTVNRGAIAIGLAAVLIVAVGAAVAVGIMPGSSVIADTPPPIMQQRHTMNDFYELREGISYDRAARTLGHQGHEVLRGTPEDTGDVPPDADVYLWPNPNGSRIVLTFVGDRLVQKRQVGLR